jgi:hypothetical protein
MKLPPPVPPQEAKSTPDLVQVPFLMEKTSFPLIMLHSKRVVYSNISTERKHILKPFCYPVYNMFLTGIVRPLKISLLVYWVVTKYYALYFGILMMSCIGQT